MIQSVRNLSKNQRERFQIEALTYMVMISARPGFSPPVSLLLPAPVECTLMIQMVSAQPTSSFSMLFEFFVLLLD